MIDLVWGIERDPDSDAFNELVVSVIVLWSEPGGTDVKEAADVTGALSHGSAVMVEDTRRIEGVLWCRVTGQVVFEDEVFIQAGWCTASLLRDMESATAGSFVDK